MTRGRNDTSGQTEDLRAGAETPMPVFFDAFAKPEFTPKPVVNMEEFQQMARRVAEIEDLLTRHVGPVYGGTQNNPHPRQQRFYREVHGPLRQSIDSTHSVTFTVDFDTLATQLYQAKLTFRLAAVRANLSTAASGGGVTSGSSSITSSGASSASSSAAGTSHSHSLSGVTTNAAGAAVSVSLPALSVTEPTTFAGTGATGATAPGTSDAGGTGASGNSNESTNHAHSSSAASWSVDTTALTNSNNVDTHTHNGPSHTHAHAATHTHTGPSHQHALDVGATYLVNTTGHTHDYTAQTVASEGSHSHTIAHTHNVEHTHTQTAHTHSLTFTTIQEGSAPSTPGVTLTINSVDVTTALGGAWDASQSDLDVTSYLRNTAGEPLRGDNTFVFTSTELLDIEIVLKSFVGSADPWSVGAVST